MAMTQAIGAFISRQKLDTPRSSRSRKLMGIGRAARGRAVAQPMMTARSFVQIAGSLYYSKSID